jgi:uncharacterized membrane protein
MESGEPLASGVHPDIRALYEVRRQLERRRSRQARVADAITRFTGSMAFVWLHAIGFGGWIVWNLAGPRALRFDPWPFVLLALAASVEAICLSTFVLITQNRLAALSERQAELDLQINLLAEREVTRLVRLDEALAQKVGGHRDQPAN